MVSVVFLESQLDVLFTRIMFLLFLQTPDSYNLKILKLIITKMQDVLTNYNKSCKKRDQEVFCSPQQERSREK